ncbi:MAG: hypothetical protein AAF851_14060 [Myxococcota bacterium]
MSLILVLLLGQPLDLEGRDPSVPGSDWARGEPSLAVDCAGAEFFGGSTLEQAGYCRLEEGSFASLRRLADRALAQQEESVRAHYLMGMSLHLGEGNLPKARYHLQRAEALFTERHGRLPGPELQPLLRLILLERIHVHGEMDDHDGKIRAVDELRDRTGIDYAPLKAWPLMKLERFEEARAVARAGIESERDFLQSVGRTALCAIESEQRNREAAYAACRASALPWEHDESDGAVEMTNAGAAAEELMRFDEAERLYLEAARRPPEGSVSPYGRLTSLYLRQARIVEAIASLAEVGPYRRRRPGAQYAQQDDAETELILATVLIVAGRLWEAERRTDRALQRPDRKGTSSAASDQSLGGAAIIDRAAKLALAAAQEEEAAIRGWSRSGFEARATALSLRWGAWRASRVARNVLNRPERLFTTFRPEVPGSVEGPEWLDFDAVDIVGPGVALRALSQSEAEETLDPKLAAPVFALFRAEAHALRGEWGLAGQWAAEAETSLPVGLALMRARASLRRAQAAEAAGQWAQARRAHVQVLSTDPSLYRRLDVRLPVMVAARPELREVASRLDASPRFQTVAWGFEMELTRMGWLLRSPGGGLIRKGTWGEAQTPVEMSLHLHDRLLAAQLRLDQTGIRSLDGMVGPSFDADQVLERLLRPRP